MVMNKIFYSSLSILFLMFSAPVQSSSSIEEFERLFQARLVVAADGLKADARTTIRREFMRTDIDFDVLLNSSKIYARLTGFPLLHASFHALSDGKLNELHYARYLWLMKKLKNHIKGHSDLDMAPMDHYTLGGAYMDCSTRLRTASADAHGHIIEEVWKARKGQYKLYNSKAFKHFAMVVNAKNTIPEEGLLDCYLFLSPIAYKRGLYQDQIRYGQEFLRLNKLFKIFEVQDGGCFPLFNVQHELAQSYYHCGQYDKAIETYKAILSGDNIYADGVRKMTLDELFILFSLYLTVNDLPSSRVLEALIQNTLPHLDSAVLRSARTKAGREEKKNQSPSKKKGKKAPQKKKTSNKNELSLNMRARFINERVDSIHKHYNEISVLECVRHLAEDTRYVIDERFVDAIRKLLASTKDISLQASKFKGKSDRADVKAVLALETGMKDHYSELKRLQEDFKKQVSAQVRIKRTPVASDPGGYAVAKVVNLKVEVMEGHEKQASKLKTKGVAIAPVVPVENEQEKLPLNINYILSGSNDVELILDTQQPWGYPANAVESLNYLNESPNLDALKEKLKTRKTDLKQLHGKNEGVWQFRVNEKIRVRFELANGGFANVRIGDFH
jgi:hypothetical protein